LIANRIRFAVEAVEATADAVGAHRMGIWLSPDAGIWDVVEEDVPELYGALLTELGRLGLAYVHLDATTDETTMLDLRRRWPGAFMVNPSTWTQRGASPYGPAALPDMRSGSCGCWRFRCKLSVLNANLVLLTRGNRMKIDISPPTNVYATFGRLNYTPWHAIAEFVDNATQSYFAARERDGVDLFPELRVQIRYSQADGLVIRDNAAGMSGEDLGRALMLSTPPSDTSGRSEFGMGLKTAACWFGSLWTVSTTRRGERWRHVVTFDVDAIAGSGAHHVEIDREPALEEEHGTTLSIGRLQRPIAGRQIEKTKRFLASIYRQDLQRGDIVLTWNGERLVHRSPVLMQWDRDGLVQDCRLSVDLMVRDPHTALQHRVRGWVGALAKMSEQDAGIALLRRGRMILGGPGQNWRVKDVVGSSNSHSGKRVVGELHVDDFPVNFTKDGFAWDGGLQDELIDALAVAVADVRDFAGNARVSKRQVEPQDFVRAVDEVQQGMDQPSYLDALSGASVPSSHDVEPADATFGRPLASREVPQELKVPLGQDLLRARLELVDGGPQQSWLSIDSDGDEELSFIVKLNTGNRFVASHLDNEGERVLVAKFALAVASAEAQVRLVFGDDVPPEELREFLSLTLDHSVS
jgi:hypothetical protein